MRPSQRNGHITKTLCWMANDALGQEKQSDYIIQKAYPLHCLPSSKVVFIPCDRFSSHDWNNHSPVHSPSIYEIVECVYGKAKVFCWGEGDSTSNNHYYLNGVLVGQRYSHVTLVGGYPFLTAVN